jgi:undecaprenyl-diphosphatase
MPGRFFLSSLLSPTPDILSQWGYWAFFVVAFAEGLPVVGVFVPGQAIAIAAGFLARTHVLRLGGVFYTILTGVILGDSFAFFLGRRYGMPLLNRFGHYVRLTPERVTKTETLIRNNPGKTIVTGRFVGVTRAIVPFLSGAVGLPFSKYIFYNVVAAVSWTVVSIGVGFLFGETLHHLSRRTHNILYVVTILAIIVGYKIYMYLERKEKNN